MTTTWGDFFSELVPSDSTCSPDSFTHRASGTLYHWDANLGEGQYGCVASYVTRAERGIVPYRFCIKTIRGDYSEAYAIAALDVLAIQSGPASVSGLVPAFVVSTSCDTYFVAMPVYDGTLSGIEKLKIDFAHRCVACVLKTVSNLWAAGLAYCDIKTSNVLRRGDTVALGDLGSITGVGDVGIFTFPPQRAFYDADSRDIDGIVENREQDIVWGIGVLIVSLTAGQDLSNTASVESLRKDPLGLDHAFQEVRSNFLAHAVALDSSTPSSTGHRCARAIRVALDAWENHPDATLERLRATLGTSPTRRVNTYEDDTCCEIIR